LPPPVFDIKRTRIPLSSIQMVASETAQARTLFEGLR